MNRIISILSVILFLPVALVPTGFMPSVVTNGGGYLMLCPSEGKRASPSDYKAILSSTSVDHHASHHHQGHGEELNSVNYDRTHEKNNELCDYVTFSSGQDLIQVPWMALLIEDTQNRFDSQTTRISIASRLRSKHSRAPPSINSLI